MRLMAVTTAQIRRRLHLAGNQLTRWRDSGLIRPLGRCHPGAWPDWTLRMAALLKIEPGTPGAPETKRAHTRMLQRTAVVLEQHPDVPFVVFVGDADPLPCWDDELVALAMKRARRAGVLCTVVSPPMLEDIPA